jgi:hypothetical protein
MEPSLSTAAVASSTGARQALRTAMVFGAPKHLDAPKWERPLRLGNASEPWRTTSLITGRPPRPWRAEGTWLHKLTEHRKTSTSVKRRWWVAPHQFGNPEDLHVREEQRVASCTPELGIGRPPRPWRAGHLEAGEEDRERKTSTSVESSPHMTGSPAGSAEDLHVRGEQPSHPQGRRHRPGRPPRPWRAGDPAALEQAPDRKTSTDVEVFRCRRPAARSSGSALHGCGGLPALRSWGDPPRACSPRMWRSSE